MVATEVASAAAVEAGLLQADLVVSMAAKRRQNRGRDTCRGARRIRGPGLGHDRVHRIDLEVEVYLPTVWTPTQSLRVPCE